VKAAGGAPAVNGWARHAKDARHARRETVEVRSPLEARISMTPDTRHADRSGEQGWALARLIGLHDGMRNDLALLRRAVAAATRDGAEADAAAAALDDLSFRQPGWSLRTYCAEFCGFVHEHHSVEDAMVFPALLQQQGVKDPELRKVIDKLSADHRVLTGYLDEVERALGALPGDEAARERAAAAVARLSERLQAHLDFEEDNLASALNMLSRVVSEADFPAPPPPERYEVSRHGQGG
jgi:Hemerythrin HHE cation binding domain